MLCKQLLDSTRSDKKRKSACIWTDAVGFSGIFYMVIELRDLEANCTVTLMKRSGTEAAAVA